MPLVRLQTSVLLLGLAVPLLSQSTPWEISLGVGSQYARVRAAEHSDQHFAQVVGRSFSLDRDYTSTSLCVARKLGSAGPWRFWARGEWLNGGTEPQALVRYREWSGIYEDTALVRGAVRQSSVSAYLEAVYSTQGWGEWGVGLGGRSTRVDMQVREGVAGRYSFESLENIPVVSGRSMKVTDPVLRCSATFVKVYREVGFVFRGVYGLNLGTRKPADGWQLEDMARLKDDVLKSAVPNAETRLELGIRF